MDDVRPLKTYCIYNTDHLFGHFAWAPGTHVFYTAFRTLFFKDFVFHDFCDFGCQRGTQNDRLFRGGNVSKTTPSPKSSQGAPREAQELPNDAKMLPEGTKMEPQGPQNLGFNIATMGTGT